MIWLVLALMTAAALFAVLWPLSRRPVAASAAPDVAIYRDQLAEIERDRAAGALGAAEAQAARIEVSRRLLAAAAASPPRQGDAARQSWHRRMVAAAALALVPLAAGSIYLALGSPGLPGQPLAERMQTASEAQSIAALIARVEAHLERTPEDGRGWEVIAPVYLRLGRYNDAVRAYRNALRLLGETVQRQADLGEALAAAANGVVTADAKAAFERAAALDGEEIRAQFYLGLAAEQDGRRTDAARLWRKLLSRGPPGAAWIVHVREALARIEDPKSKSGGPSADDMAAAADMAPAERERAVRGMVERLAARLNEDGTDVDGWLRLMRAYMVLGERGKAQAAAAAARRALSNEPDKLRRIEDGAKNFGLDG